MNLGEGFKQKLRKDNKKVRKGWNRRKGKKRNTEKQTGLRFRTPAVVKLLNSVAVNQYNEERLVGFSKKFSKNSFYKK